MLLRVFLYDIAALHELIGTLWFERCAFAGVVRRHRFYEADDLHYGASCKPPKSATVQPTVARLVLEPVRFKLVMTRTYCRALLRSA